MKRRYIFLLFVLILALFLYPITERHFRAASLLLRIEDPHSLIATFHTDSVQESLLVLPDAIRARIYIPTGVKDPSGMVVVHGIHHLGIDEPRLVAFARALAQSGVLVLTPELPGIADYKVTPGSIATIGDAATYLHRRIGHRVGVLGLSFSGGLSLMAAADPRFRNHFAFVFAVGAHDDMARVARFLATGTTQAPDGSTVSLQPHEYGALILVYSDIDRFFSVRDAPIAALALHDLLYERLDDARAEADHLSPAGRNSFALLMADKRAPFRDGLLAMIAAKKSELADVSPHGHMSNIRVPVLLLHGAGDQVIPSSESLWLAQEIPPNYLKEVLISPAITHVEVGGEPRLLDKLRLIHLLSLMFVQIHHSKSTQ